MLRTFFPKNDDPDIVFRCREDLIDGIPHPIAASKMMPEWFKKLSRDIEGQDKSDSGTVKRCIPVLDAMSLGYIIPLWADLHVKVSDAYILYDHGDNIIDIVKEMSESPEDAVGMEHNSGVVIAKVEKTNEPYIWCKFPEQFDPYGGGDMSNHSWQQMGELCDLKKFTLVDTDTYKTKVNFPYVWTGSTTGEWIIPKGTPLVQVIPFKRKKLNLHMGFTDQFAEAKINAKLSSVMFDRYRRLFWHKGKEGNGPLNNSRDTKDGTSGRQVRSLLK